MRVVRTIKMAKLAVAVLHCTGSEALACAHHYLQRGAAHAHLGGLRLEVVAAHGLQRARLGQRLEALKRRHALPRALPAEAAEVLAVGLLEGGVLRVVSRAANSSRSHAW